MGAYFLRRLLTAIPTLVGITFLVFAVTRLVPGGPIDQMLVELRGGMDGGMGGDVGGADPTLGADLPPELRAALERRYNLDKPIVHAWALWLADVARGDLGTSYRYDRPVAALVRERLPISIWFGLIGFVLAYGVCVPLGIAKAVRSGTRFDVATSALVFAGYSIPGWALGAALLVLFGGGSFLDLVPLGGFRSENWATLGPVDKLLDQLHHSVLPVLAYAVGSFATLTVLTRNSMLDNLGQDYVRTAYAKGLSERRVLLRHVLRNSLIPICTGLGHAISLVVAGSYIVEKVFNIDGLGYLGYRALVDRDYAVVMGTLVINASLGLLGNILSDALYVLADPRIRYT